MKKFLLILSVITVLIACNSKTDSTSPTVALDNMFTAMKNGSLDDIKKFITRSDVALLEAGEQFLKSVDPEAIKKMKERLTADFKEKVKNVTYTLKNEKINGDNATVDAEVTQDGKTESHTFDLVKEDGSWKIALTKSGNGMFNSTKGNLGKRDDDLQTGIERLKKMDPDSVKMLINKGLQAYDSAKKKMDH